MEPCQTCPYPANPPGPKGRRYVTEAEEDALRGEFVRLLNTTLPAMANADATFPIKAPGEFYNILISSVAGRGWYERFPIPFWKTLPLTYIIRVVGMARIIQREGSRACVGFCARAAAQPAQKETK